MRTSKLQLQVRDKKYQREVLEINYWELRKQIAESRKFLRDTELEILEMKEEMKRFIRERNVVERKTSQLSTLSSKLKKYLGWPQVMENWNVWEKNGFHCYPINYEAPMPVLSQENRDKFRIHPRILPGIEIKDSVLISTLKVCSEYIPEFKQFLRKKDNSQPFTYYWNNTEFGIMDALIYHCMIRNKKPQKVLEVGCGMRTLVSYGAREKNYKEGSKLTLECIGFDSRLDANEYIKFIKEPVQSLSLQKFLSLEENDILSINSSHVLHFASDVRFLVLDVFPILKKGVIVHINEIYLPSDMYPEKYIFDEHRFYNEDDLMRAFLMFNTDYEVIWGGTYACRWLKNEVKSYLKTEKCHTGLWMKRIREPQITQKKN